MTKHNRPFKGFVIGDFIVDDELKQKFKVRRRFKGGKKDGFNKHN